VKNGERRSGRWKNLRLEISLSLSSEFSALERNPGQGENKRAGSSKVTEINPEKIRASFRAPDKKGQSEGRQAPYLGGGIVKKDGWRRRGSLF